MKKWNVTCTTKKLLCTSVKKDLNQKIFLSDFKSHNEIQKNSSFLNIQSICKSENKFSDFLCNNVNSSIEYPLCPTSIEFENLKPFRH